MISKIKNIVTSILLTCVSILMSSIFWPSILIFSTILFPIRYVVQKLLDIIYGPNIYTLSHGIDSLFVYDKFPNSSAIINVVLIIKGEPNLEKIREKFSKDVFKLIDINSSSESKAIYADRLQKIFTSKFGFACWKDASVSFDINRHIRYMDGLEPINTSTNVDKPMNMITEDMLHRKISELMDECTLFENEHPQWELLIVPNYHVQNSSSPHFVAIGRSNHAYTDGGSFGLLCDAAIGDTPFLFAINPLIPLPGTNILNESLLHLKAGVFGPLAFILTLKSAIMDKSKFILPQYSKKKHVNWSNPIDVRILKEIRNGSGTSISTTSILVTALTGAMQKFHAKNFGNIPPEINIGNMCIMLPYKTMELTNQFTTFSLPCPLGGVANENMDRRLRKTNKLSRELTLSSEPIFNYFIMRFTGYLPKFMINVLGNLAGTPVVFSNLPGATAPFGLFGGVVVDMGTWLPMLKTFGMGISTYGFNGQLRICITTDSLIFKRREDLKCFIDDVELELKKLANCYGIEFPMKKNVDEINDDFVITKQTNLNYNYKCVNYRKPYPTA